MIVNDVVHHLFLINGNEYLSVDVQLLIILTIIIVLDDSQWW